MRLVARDLMERNVLTIPESAPFREVQRLLVVAGCHGAPVVDWEGRVIGVVTAMDLLRAADQAMDEDLDPDETDERNMSKLTAHELATPDPIWVQPDTPASAIAQRMRAEGAHRVLVGVDGKLEGIVSSFDLARAVSE